MSKTSRGFASVMRLAFVRDRIEGTLTGTSPKMKNISKPALLGLVFPVSDLGTQQRLIDALHDATDSARRKRAQAASTRQAAWSVFESSLFGALPEAGGGG